MGLNQANSNYACLYCHVHKDNRYNTSVCRTLTLYMHMYLCIPFTYSDGWLIEPFLVGLSSLLIVVSDLKDKKGCKFFPLIKIPIDNIVIDELHLMLHITDVLLRNSVWAMEKLDQDERQQGKQRSRFNNHLDKLINTIRSCRITFRVYI